MTDEHRSYTIEPPQERQREMSRDRKLDRIIDLLTHHDEPVEDEHAPEVSFEADPDSLPTEAGDEEPPEDEAGQGEGTNNVSDQMQRGSGFRHPSARRHAVMER